MSATASSPSRTLSGLAATKDDGSGRIGAGAGATDGMLSRDGALDGNGGMSGISGVRACDSPLSLGLWTGGLSEAAGRFSDESGIRGSGDGTGRAPASSGDGLGAAGPGAGLMGIGPTVHSSISSILRESFPCQRAATQFMASAASPSPASVCSLWAWMRSRSAAMPSAPARCHGSVRPTGSSASRPRV